jgi:hypothetical protein
MAKKDKMQMVDDDQIENVGIMSGFMDDLDEVMAEIEEEMKGKEGDSSDMAGIMSRRPDSPEILMNNLRGDYRSVEARREELADLVGYDNAAETPDDVLALLQPVLAQQGIASLGGMPPAPPEAAMMPPASMPSGAPLPGGVASLPMDQGPMPPMPMAKGGEVKYFQEGGDASTTTTESTMSYSDYPPELVERAKQIYLQQFAQGPTEVPIPDLMTRTKELQPQFAELLGTGDKETARGQMMLDIAQAALNFAGNVGPSGQPLVGSMASRLAGAASQLPAQISARVSEARKGEQQATLAALQQAQSEVSSAQALSAAEKERYFDVLEQAAKSKSFRTLTTKEKENRGLDVNRAWQVDQTGKLYAPGGQPPANINVNSGETYAEALAKYLAEDDRALVNNAQKSVSNLSKIDQTLNSLLNEDINTGIGANFFTTFDRLKGQFGADELAANRATQDQFLDSLLGSAVFEQIGALGIGARGLDTPAEREFLREVLTGTRSLSKETLLEMTQARRDRDIQNIQLYNDRVERGDLDAYFDIRGGEKRKLEIPEPPAVRTERKEDDIPPVPEGIEYEVWITKPEGMIWPLWEEKIRRDQRRG